MFNWFRTPPAPAPEPKSPGFFSTDHDPRMGRTQILTNAVKASFQKTVDDFSILDASGAAIAMDSNIQQVKVHNRSIGQNVPDVQLGWYASQGFIGYQMMAIMSQHWLIDKACTMPARDAMRNGYEITINDGTAMSPKTLAKIKKADKRFMLNKNCVEFVRSGRVFGIRIAMFIVESKDPDYYLNPFNIDGVTKGSYRGISQIDPYWITPELSQSAAVNPASMDFYEPTWWRVNGQRIHRSHLIIMRTNTVPDILKPTYLYGGVSIPQKIFERVYAAERTANEAPMLAMSKRLTSLKVDMAAVIADQEGFEAKMAIWTNFMNNFGVKIIGGDEEIVQFDTSLTDMDAVIMTQYQLVAAASEVPATKLLGTTPKGFNATGEYESDSYHEFLESIQEHDFTALIERHHLLVLRSELGISDVEIEINWEAVDSPTAEEQANINKTKADTDSVLVSAGAIDGQDVRARLIADKDSGYTGMAAAPESGFNDEGAGDDPDGDKEPE